MESSIAAQLQNVQVKFIPSLHEQRRAWVLDALRRESATSSMENSIAAQLQNVQVKFIPPLHEQRRAWVLDALRRESVTSVGL